MNTKLKERAVKLRLEKELSYSEIRKILNVPKSTLSGWLRDFPLSEKRILELQRTNYKRNEAKIERFRNTMREKKEKEGLEIYKKYQKKFSRLSKDVFFGAGLMLYLSEGSKKDYYTISISNTDADVINFFIKWLDEFLNVSKDKIKIALHLYENMDIKKEKDFWRNKLGIKESQFYKPWVSKLQKSSFSYKESFRHGTCKTCIFSSKKKAELMGAIRSFVDRYNN